MTKSARSSSDPIIFDNCYIRDLPGDPETGNFIRQVRGALYSEVLSKPAKAPKLVAYSKEMAEMLGFSEDYCQSDEFLQVFAGNQLLNGMEPFAMCYGGHQFGVWAGQLGDGRVVNLGDAINSTGERWALQLKGAGLTPYSRHADGLAVLRSSIREFLCSEAMYHLRVPTTRALSVAVTGESVIRDMFYNGNPQAEQGAIVCRTAPSFIRFGHFQICAAQGDLAMLKRLIDHVIRTYCPHLGEPSPAVYRLWFEEVCTRTARLMVEWERVGFVHGVMNTDNMSILGLTIDYGPYGWLEAYDPHWTPNTTDAEEKRYRFSNQPACAYWNLVQLANALYPLYKDTEPLQIGLTKFVDCYESGRQIMLTHKLGLINYLPEIDKALHEDLFGLLSKVETDMTIFFRLLAEINLEDIEPEKNINALSSAYYQETSLSRDYVMQLNQWLMRYSARAKIEEISVEDRKNRMNRVNPKYLLRNYLAQLAIDKAEHGDFTLVQELLELLRKPYDEQPANQHFAVKRPDWARNRSGCSMLSCSS